MYNVQNFLSKYRKMRKTSAHFVENERERNELKTGLWFVVVFTTKIRESHSRSFWESLGKTGKGPGFLKEVRAFGDVFGKSGKDTMSFGYGSEKEADRQRSRGCRGPGRTRSGHCRRGKIQLPGNADVVKLCHGIRLLPSLSESPPERRGSGPGTGCSAPGHIRPPGKIGGSCLG